MKYILTGEELTAERDNLMPTVLELQDRVESLTEYQKALDEDVEELTAELDTIKKALELALENHKNPRNNGGVWCPSWNCLTPNCSKEKAIQCAVSHYTKRAKKEEK